MNRLNFPQSRLAAAAATAAATAVLALAACSSTPPKPDKASGEVIAANTNAEVLAELLQLAKAGMPRHFSANRGVDVRQVMQSWAQTAGLKLNWQSQSKLKTTGGIEEYEIRAAVIALAQQFPGDAASLVVQFPDSNTMLVTDAQTKTACPEIPAGSIVVGKYCAVTPVAPARWYVDPSDVWLSTSFVRWAKDEGLDLEWGLDADLPITTKTRRAYSGDLLQALNAALKDVAKAGTPLRFAVSVTDKTITVNTKEKP